MIEDYKLVDDAQEGFRQFEAQNVNCLNSTVSLQQLFISGVSQRVILRRAYPIWTLMFNICIPAVLHPWQVDQPLLSLVDMDLLNHNTQLLPRPNRWHISQHNARVLILLISDPDWTQPTIRVGLDAAHDKMLCALYNQSETPTERFLSVVQQTLAADLNHHVPWSRHLLSCHPSWNFRGRFAHWRSSCDVLPTLAALLRSQCLSMPLIWSWVVSNLGQQYPLFYY